MSQQFILGSVAFSTSCTIIGFEFVMHSSGMSFQIIWAFKSSRANSANMFLFQGGSRSCHVVIIDVGTCLRSGSMIQQDNFGIITCMSIAIVFQVNILRLEQQITRHTFVLQKYLRYCPVNFLKVLGEFRPGDMGSVADPARKNAFGNTFWHFRVFLGFRQCW